MKNFRSKFREFSALVLLLAFLSSFVSAQSKINVDPDPNFIRQTVVRANRIAVVRPMEVKEDWAPVFKTIDPIHAPGMDLEKDQFLALKAAANLEKENLQSGIGAAPALKTNLLNPPVQGTNFLGNTNDGSVPTDNAIAVSKAGMVLSATNSRIHMYNSSGGLLASMSLGSFVTGNGIPFNGKFDPKVVYDPDADRFIVVFLNGASPSSSLVVFCFSQTNDPTGDWNVYSVSGNALGNVWCDFPSIGISTDELLITGNLFTGSSAQGGVLWQIPLADGYAGNTMSVQPWTNNYFSLHPVGGGLTMYGPKFYLIRTSSSGSNEVFVHELTNSAANGGVFNNPITLQLTSFGVPPEASMKGTARVLQTNDCRVQSSYFENNRIQFTLNTAFQGKPAIYYGTIIISPFLISFSAAHGKYIFHDEYEYAYGAVAYAGTVGADGTNASFVSFNFTSPNHYPGNAAIYIDEYEEVSPPRILKAGISPISGSSPARWGDYSDIAERHNFPGEAWVGASYGPDNGNQRTYISQIKTPLPVGAPEEIQPNSLELEVYPNPVSDRITFEFEVPVSAEYLVEIWDPQGKKVKTLIEDKLKAGLARLAFSTSPLADGMYIVIITSANEVLFKNKFVVNH